MPNTLKISKYKQMKKILFISFASIFLFLLNSCETGPDRSTVVGKLKSSSKLSTVEYTITKVVSSKNEGAIKTYFFAETEARIKAGIDLNKLKEEDIIIEDKKINLTLPQIEIISFSYPSNSFRVIDRYTYDSKLAPWKNFNFEKRDELFRQAEDDIKQRIKDLGITETAKKNTIKFLEPILRSIGFTEIYIKFKDEEDKKNNNEEQADESKEAETKK